MRRRSTIEEALLAANLGEYINKEETPRTRSRSKAKSKRKAIF